MVDVEGASGKSVPGNGELVGIVMGVEQCPLSWAIGLDEPRDRVPSDFALLLQGLCALAGYTKDAGTSASETIIDSSRVQRLGVQISEIGKSANGRSGSIELLAGEVTAVNYLNGDHAVLGQQKKLVLAFGKTGFLCACCHKRSTTGRKEYGAF